ncbi:MAG: response regulator transcription factor [Actinobacteria bacterium]|nr:response regulator transcription factor [Actinomycetota bacterium]
MRLLVVEDDAGIGRFLRQGLIEAGYEVDWERDGAQGLERAVSAVHDLLILDVLLPDLNGLELLSRLRSIGIKSPVLLLTALDTVDDRVRGLDSGADDYLVKPFAFAELLARVRALLRRPRPEAEPILSAGSIEMDVTRREVRESGRLVTLSRREFALLEYMLRHRGEVLTRTQIAERVWGFDFYHESNVVDVYIGYLRRKLGHDRNRAVIRTIRGMGFILDEDDGSNGS